MGLIVNFLEKKHSGKKWFLFIKQLLCRYEDDGVSEIGAQLTYYLILSVFPFLIFFLSILKFTPLADAGVLERLLAVLPGNTQKILYDIITEIMKNGNFALLSFGAVGALWSSSNGIMSVIKSVNRAFDLDESRPFWKLRGLSILFTISLYIVLIIAFSILIFGEVFFNLIFVSYTWPSFIIWKILKVFVPLLFMGIMLSFLYKFSPSIKDGINVKFSETIPGSIFASIGIIIYSALFSFYVNNFGNYSKSYGSIGGLIVLLIWIYSISIVIVLGAEVNATLISMKSESISENELSTQ
jgi:membrane protein